MKSSNSKVLVSVLHWNNSSDTDACLKSLAAQDTEDFSVLVIDNGSNTPYKLPGVKPRSTKLVRNDENLGFSEGHNQAFRHARKNNYACLLILNNDTVAKQSLVSGLMDALVRSGSVAVCPAIDYLPGKDRLWYGGGALSLITGKSHHVQAKHVDFKPSEKPVETTFLTGACLMIAISKIDDDYVFNDDYFAYWEDTDFSARMLSLSKSLAYLPKILISHRVSKSFSNSPLQHYYMTRNHLLFVKNNVKLRFKPIAWLVFFYYFLRRLLGSLIRLRLDNARLIIKALLDHLRGKYGKY